MANTNPAQSQLFSNKINVDQQAPPIHHIGLGVAVLAGIVIGIGIVNYKADH